MAGLLDYLGINPLPFGGSPDGVSFNGGGLLDGLGAGIANNSNALMMMGAGIAGGRNWGDALSRGFQGFGQGQQTDMGRQNQAATVQALMNIPGMTPQKAMLAALNPKVMEAASKTLFPEYQFQKAGQMYGGFSPGNGAFVPQGIAPELTKLTPGEVAGYASPPMPATASVGPPTANGQPTVSVTAAQPGGFNQVATGGPEKPPPGYDYVDKNNPDAGLKATPGGPATVLPPEAAGRLAMMESARPNLDAARKYFLGPDFTHGPINAIGQATNSFEIGRHQRAVDLAVEAALRIATGANAPESEVKQYANFYRPSIYDTVETRKQKLDALQKFIDTAIGNYRQGRTTDLRPDAYMAGTPASNFKNGGPLPQISKNQDPLGFR